MSKNGGGVKGILRLKHFDQFQLETLQNLNALESEEVLSGVPKGAKAGITSTSLMSRCI